MTIGDDGIATRDNAGASWKGNQGYKPCKLYAERKFHDWRWLGWPLTDPACEEKWCDMCGLVKRPRGGKWTEVGYRKPSIPTPGDAVRELPEATQVAVERLAKEFEYAAWKGFNQSDSEFEKGYKHAMGVAANRVRESLAKKEGDDGPTDNKAS